LKMSGLGKAVMLIYRHPKEIRQNKDRAGKLISKTISPLFYHPWKPRGIFIRLSLAPKKENQWECSLLKLVPEVRFNFLTQLHSLCVKFSMFINQQRVQS